mgnify:CR=1 FL=1
MHPLGQNCPQGELKSMSEIVYTSIMELKKLSEQHGCKVECFLPNGLNSQSLKKVQVHPFQYPPFWQTAASDIKYIIQVGNRWTGLFLA